MIFSIDHITLTCSNSHQACRSLKAMGYKENFSALNVPNPMIKQSLMRKWSASHDLFFFEKPHSFNIEVIKYELVCDGTTFFSPVLGNTEYSSDNESPLIVQDKSYWKVRWPGLKTGFFITDRADMIGKTIIIFAGNLELAYKFWSLFGLKILKKEPSHYLGVFQTPFPKRFFLSFLVAKGYARKPLLIWPGLIV